MQNLRTQLLMNVNKLFLLMAMIALFPILILAKNTEKQPFVFEAENALKVEGAAIQNDIDAFGGKIVRLTKYGDEIIFENLPGANKLAIRYASINVGTISVAVNNHQAVKVNVHSSGAVTGSFLHAILDIDIPKGAQLYIGLDSSDVAINIDNITV